MNKITLFCAALLLCACVSDSKAPATDAPRIDLSAADAFFEMAGRIRSGQTPSDEDWTRMFGTEGYVVAVPREDSRQDLREATLLAFDPARRAERDSIIHAAENDSNPWAVFERWQLINLADMDRNWDKLTEFRRTYDFQSVPARCVAGLKEFMIDPIDDSIPLPTTYIVCFERDGYGGDEIQMDLNLFYIYDEQDRINFLAHEMFHAYRYAQGDAYYKWLEADPLLRVIEFWQNEGIADLIDKRGNAVAFLQGAGIPKAMLEEYALRRAATPEALRTVDSLTHVYLGGRLEKDAYKDGVQQYIQFLGGHVNGFYMSQRIEKAGLRDEMLRTFHSPFEFMRLYNRAAEKLGEYRLSDEFMVYLDTLEAQAPVMEKKTAAVE